MPDFSLPFFRRISQTHAHSRSGCICSGARGWKNNTLCLWYPFFVVIVREFLLWCDVRHGASVLVRRKLFFALTHSLAREFSFLCVGKVLPCLNARFLDVLWTLFLFSWMMDGRLSSLLVDFILNLSTFSPLALKLWRETLSNCPQGTNFHWVIVCVSINNHKISFFRRLLLVLVIYVRITDWSISTFCVRGSHPCGIFMTFFYIKFVESS